MPDKPNSIAADAATAAVNNITLPPLTEAEKAIIRKAVDPLFTVLGVAVEAVVDVYAEKIPYFGEMLATAANQEINAGVAVAQAKVDAWLA